MSDGVETNIENQPFSLGLSPEAFLNPEDKARLLLVMDGIADVVSNSIRNECKRKIVADLEALAVSLRLGGPNNPTRSTQDTSPRDLISHPAYLVGVMFAFDIAKEVIEEL